MASMLQTGHLYSQEQRNVMWCIQSRLGSVYTVTLKNSLSFQIFFIEIVDTTNDMSQFVNKKTQCCQNIAFTKTSCRTTGQRRVKYVPIFKGLIKRNVFLT